MRRPLQLLILLLLSCPAVRAQSGSGSSIDVAVVAEDDQTAAVGSLIGRRTPAHSELVPFGGSGPWSLAVLNVNEGCLRGAGETITVTRGQHPQQWPTPVVEVFSSVRARDGQSSCATHWPRAGIHTVQLRFLSPDRVEGFLRIHAVTSDAGAVARVDADGDGQFEYEGTRFDALPLLTLEAGVPCVVRVQTGAELSTVGESDARVLVEWRAGRPMATRGEPCQRGGAEFTLFGWADETHLHLESDGFPYTQLSPVLVIGMREEQIPLTRSGCLLLTDLYVPILWPTPTVPRIASQVFPPDARGALFYAQWLVAGDTSGGTVDWWASNAVRVELPN